MNQPELPDSELEVLACLWKHGSMTAREIREAMHGYRPLHHSSVSTLLKRLQEKGCVTRTKGSVGKAFVFQATEAPRATYRRIVKDLLERVFGGNRLELVSSLFEVQDLTVEELDRVEQLVDELRRKRNKKGDRP